MQHQEDLRQIVCQASLLGIPTPALMATLSYFDAYRSAWLPANLIQAQRDYFGAHTYERIDTKGTFHTEWEKDYQHEAIKTTSLDELCVNTIRTLSIDAVQKANSGHPGLPLGAAPMAYILWTHFLKHNPANPQWYDRDRFVLSAGMDRCCFTVYCISPVMPFPWRKLNNFVSGEVSRQAIRKVN